MSHKKIIIVGGVAGGASAAARLRRMDEHAHIIMLEKGEYISFANCGLPYYVGGEITQKSALTLQTPQSFHARFNIDVRTQSEAIEINREAKTVLIHDQKTGNTYPESYDKLILSMGAEPIIPPIEGATADRVFTLRNIADTYRIKDYIDSNHPKTALVVGGGYIGVEMVENLHQAGLAVTLVEMQNQLIAPLDFDMACEVHQYIKGKGVVLHLEKSVCAIHQTESNLTVVLNTNEEILVDMVIMAVGVSPESKIAQKAGLEINTRRAIKVTPEMLTNDPDIYAVGDATETLDFITGHQSFIPLAGPANKQGRIAANNISGEKTTYTGTQGSAIVKIFDMTIATTGINEKTAKTVGLDYEKSFTYSASHAGYYPGASNMSIKVLFEPQSGKILGAQIVGYEGVDKRCDVIATAIRFGGTAEDLTQLELCYAPPYSSAKDPVNMAGFTIENLRAGLVKNFHWHDVALLEGNPHAILLDTRTKTEYEKNHIEGFRNIPLDNLRSRLSELDKNKKIYVTCQVGLRGYIACRILSQHGFDCFNLSGGYHLYHSIFGNRE
ncbi:MAG: FAD-dependent oxidoreductase [Brevinema sp.]